MFARIKTFRFVTTNQDRKPNAEAACDMLQLDQEKVSSSTSHLPTANS